VLLAFFERRLSFDFLRSYHSSGALYICAANLPLSERQKVDNYHLWAIVPPNASLAEALCCVRLELEDFQVFVRSSLCVFFPMCFASLCVYNSLFS
jgi:hypothetical protein